MNSRELPLSDVFPRQSGGAEVRRNLAGLRFNLAFHYPDVFAAFHLSHGA